VGVTVRPIEVNGQPAVSLVRDGAVIAVTTITLAADGIGQILWVMNPQKLTRIPVVPA
jgi:RNA polymerase sigma-70 factor (ECF subfamily)